MHILHIILQVAVYKGSAKPLLGLEIPDSRHHHGSDGLGGAKHSTDPDLTLIRDTPAALAIIELVNKYPGELFRITTI